MKWKAPSIFYGWWIVAASFVIAIYVGGAIFFGFTAIFEPIAEEFGWSYTQISLASSLRGLEVGLLAPVAGVLVDRYGPRKMIIIGTLLLALSMFMLSNMQNLVMFYAAFWVMAMGVSATTATVLMTAVAHWFRAKVGIASGISLAGYAVGGLMVPVMVWLIDLYGWRMTMTITAVGLLVICLPLALVFRHKPEQYGYLPDGEIKSTEVAENVADLSSTEELAVTGKHAVWSGAFWHISLAFACHIVMTSAIMTHVMPYLSSINIARSVSGVVTMAIPLISLGGRVGLGWLGDRVDKRKVAAAAFAFSGLGLLAFEFVPVIGSWLLVPFIILFGTGWGGGAVMRSALSREYFGRAHFGTIFGFITGINSIGAITGAPLVGWVFDTWGSYQGVWGLLTGISVVAVILVMTTARVKTTPARYVQI